MDGHLKKDDLFVVIDIEPEMIRNTCILNAFILKI